MASIRVAIAQLNFRLGDFESNVAAIVDAYKKSVEQDADVVVFSELAVCGYPPEDLLLKQRFIEEAGEAVQQIAAQCSETVAIVGFPEAEGQNYITLLLFAVRAKYQEFIESSCYPTIRFLTKNDISRLEPQLVRYSRLPA